MPQTEEPLKIGSLHRIKIEGIGSFGEGLARLNGAEIFVPKTCMGDQAEVKILESKKGRYRAEVQTLISPGESRRPPECKHFEVCGGCDFQHLPYEEQLAWKLRITKHWVRRSPLAPTLDKILFDQIAAPSEFYYRHRVRLQVKNGKIHFFKPHSNQIFEIEECPILEDGFLNQLQKRAKDLPDIRDWNQSFREGKLIDRKASYILDGCEISFDENCFTQGNLTVNELIWNRIKEDFVGLERMHSALDLYCGVGNFSLPLSKYFKEVTGVETESRSLDWARKNSSQIQWMAGSAEEVLLDLEKKRAFFDFVLLDPPRAGANVAVRTLHRLMPPKISYVSCNLESLTQDLVILVKHGGYKIQRWTVADMFPQTHHIESIVSLSR